MKMKNFVSILMGSIGGLLFALGMCMCLLPEWNAFKPGLVSGVIGIIVLLVMWIVRRKMEGKPAVKINGKTVGTVIFGIMGALVFGTGMCMIMAWNGMLVSGIIVGVVGIFLLLCLIPICKGLK